MVSELVQFFLHIPREEKDRETYTSAKHQDDALENLKRDLENFQDNAFTSQPYYSPFEAFQLQQPQH